jgi:hypothetical protein
MKYQTNYHDYLIYELQKNTKLNQQEIFNQIYLFSKTQKYKDGYNIWLKLNNKPIKSYSEQTHALLRTK